jgi:hypothetical protein
MSGLIVSALSWPKYANVSCWIGVVLVLMAVTVVHLVFTYGLVVCLPHIAILVSGLQYVLAAWLSFYYPSSNPLFNIGARLPEYLSYAGWVMTAVCLGWAFSLRGLRESSIPPAPGSTRLLAELDVLFWIGITGKLLSHWGSLGPLNFVLLLCADFRYLGALGRMLVSGRGWKWRILLALVLEMLLATGEAMFHSLLLWSAAVFAIYIYKTRPKRIVVAGMMCLGFLVLPALQQAKVALRERTWSDDSTGVNLGSLGNAINFSKDVGGGMVKWARGDWDASALGDIGARYNQGWIIDRVMQNVPAFEPYAKGETLLAAVEAAVMPRLIDSGKTRAGGSVNMRRYAGHVLVGGTSMNLGYAGEMYANFGYWGGIAGCFFYAFLLGLAFRWAFRRATLQPLWWALVPYVGLIGLKAEDGIADVWNWLVKATLVGAAVYYAFPEIRAALSADRMWELRRLSGNVRFSRQCQGPRRTNGVFGRSVAVARKQRAAPSRR